MHIGAIAGRYANRIGGGRFTLDGREYRLPTNDGRNTLHGGPRGFAYLVWQAEPDGETLRLTLHSPDGDQGFPGALDAVVEYRLDGDALVIDYAATADAPTVVNLTNHAYFNLSGEASVLKHVLHVPSSRITALDAELIPTGEIRDIAGTPLDFRTPTAIGARIGEPNDQLQRGGGYDLNYVLADAPRAAPALAATLSAGGMVMTVLTTEPGLQFYSGNFLRGAPFAWRSACCLETQHFTDSLNHPAFPTTVLRPGERFASRTVYRFNAG
jgi:aldose 1-epimerase